MFHGHFPIEWSLGIIVGVIAVSIVLSLVFPKPPGGEDDDGDPPFPLPPGAGFVTQETHHEKGKSQKS